MGNALTDLAVRDATLEDAALLLRWRNDPEARRNSFNSDEIRLEDHLSWLRRKLDDPACVLFVAELNGIPVGQVRLDRTGPDMAEISVAVAPEARRRGIGRRLIAAGSMAGAQRLAVNRVVALIKEDNAESIAAFRAAGYEPVRDADDGPHRVFQWQD